MNLDEYIKKTQQAKLNKSTNYATKDDSQGSLNSNNNNNEDYEEDELIYVETEDGLIKEYKKRVPKNNIITEQYLQ